MWLTHAQHQESLSPMGHVFRPHLWLIRISCRGAFPIYNLLLRLCFAPAPFGVAGEAGREVGGWELGQGEFEN